MSKALEAIRKPQYTLIGPGPPRTRRTFAAVAACSLGRARFANLSDPPHTRASGVPDYR